MEDYSGKPIEPQEAWLMFDRWKSHRQQIGVIFWGSSTKLYAMGAVESAQKGKIALRGDSTHAAADCRSSLTGVA